MAALGFPICMYIFLLMYLSLIIYTVLGVILIIKYRKVVLETQSVLRRLNLVWLEWTMIIFISTLLLDLADQFLFKLNGIFGISYTHVSFLILINWIFYKGLKQPQIFEGITEQDEK